MAEVTRRCTGELLRRLFEILTPHAEGLQARDALAAVEQSVALSEYEQSTYESGGRRFEKIVRFATVDCVKAEWLLKNKGRWIVTDAGKRAYSTFTDPEIFSKEAVRLYNEWKARQPDSDPEPQEGESQEPPTGKTARITFEEAEEQAWTEIEQYAGGMKPHEFQELVASLLRAMAMSR